MAERIAPSLVLALVAAGAPLPAQATLDGPSARVEERVEEVTEHLAERVESMPVAGELARRIRVGASWTGAYLRAAPGSQYPDQGLGTWDARLFADADLAYELEWGGRRLANAVGVSVEWELYRLGDPVHDFGEVYLDLQGLAGSTWLNVQVGRFQIPVGENYLRFGRAWSDNPFLSNTVGGTWWWDEGVRVHGAAPDGRIGYVASWSSGETPRSFDLEGDGQLTLKLHGRPVSWLRVSASALWSAATGSDREPASAALWLGEAWGRAFGSGSPVPNLQDGARVPDAPGRIDGTLYLGADAVATHPRGARLWLSYGVFTVRATGSGSYDRTLHTWIAELVLEGRLISPDLRRLHLALRANGLGTYDAAEGYLLDVRYTVPYGYNMESLEAYSVAVGWRLLEWVRLTLEYTRQDVDLVQGAGGIGLRGRSAHYWGAALGVSF